MTMWALSCQVKEVGRKIKNLAIKYARNRKLNDRMVGGDDGWNICRGSTDQS